jgi:hypothetical protein
VRGTTICRGRWIEACIPSLSLVPPSARSDSPGADGHGVEPVKTDGLEKSTIHGAVDPLPALEFLLYVLVVHPGPLRRMESSCRVTSSQIRSSRMLTSRFSPPCAIRGTERPCAKPLPSFTCQVETIGM